MNLKNVRNALCITAVSAAVALSAIPVSAPVMIVQAEEAQVTALDSILRQMYGLYQNRDFVSMYEIGQHDSCLCGNDQKQRRGQICHQP